MNIINELWSDVKNDPTPEGTKIYNYLNLDNLSSLILEGGVWWKEVTCQQSTYPEHVHQYLLTHMNDKYKAKYLFDV